MKYALLPLKLNLNDVETLTSLENPYKRVEMQACRAIFPFNEQQNDDKEKNVRLASNVCLLLFYL